MLINIDLLGIRFGVFLNSLRMEESESLILHELVLVTLNKLHNFYISAFLIYKKGKQILTIKCCKHHTCNLTDAHK